MREYLYWLGLVFIVVYLLFDGNKYIGRYKSFFYFPLFIFLSFALAITVDQFDIGVYRNIYDKLSDIPSSWHIDMYPEYGYQVINYISKVIFGLSFEQYRFLYSLVVLYLVYFMVKRYTQYQGVYYLLYYPKFYLVGLISHMRSGIVNPFIYLCIDLASRKKYVEIVLISVLLSQIHLSAIFMLFFIFLDNIRLRYVYILGVIPLSLLFYYYIFPEVNYYVNYLGVRQVNYIFYEGERKSMYGFELIRRALIVVVVLYLYHYGKINERRDALVAKVFLLSIFVYIGFFDAKYISDRMGGMLSFVEPLIIIQFFQSHTRIGNSIYAYVFVVLYAMIDFALRAFYLEVLPGHLDIIRDVNI